MLQTEQDAHEQRRSRGCREMPRKLRRLYDKRGAMTKALTREYFKYNKVKMLDGSEPVF